MIKVTGQLMPDFTEALCDLGAACYLQGIDPKQVEIHLPDRLHWELLCTVARAGLHSVYRDPLGDSRRGFTYLGFHFKPKVDV